ncbi:translational machinery component [Trametopsis cervina]|nr:translational machinery component [Trametopsis cervina]
MASRLPTQSTITRFASSASSKQTQFAAAQPEDVANDPFGYTLMNRVSEVKPSSIYDRPPAPPRGAYPKPNPPQPNPLKAQQRTLPGASDAQDDVPPPPKPLYRVYVKATRNNIIMTLTRPNGNLIRTHTGGACGFKHVNRSTHEAAHQCAVKMFKTIEEGILPQEPEMALHLYMQGFGKGREAVKQALLGVEGENLRPRVMRLTDKTPIKIGGNRAKKVRRI